MRKGLLALLAVLVLSAGALWAETKNANAKDGKACAESASCCCCSKSCPK